MLRLACHALPRLLVLLATLAAAAGAAAAPSPPAMPASDGTRFGRARQPLAPELLELFDYHANASTLQAATFPAQTRIHRAHTVMLAEQRIIARAEAAAILRGLSGVNAAAGDDPALHEYMAYETALIRAAGPVAGRMHIGRSRNDLSNTANRMYYRTAVNEIVSAQIELREALIARAQQHLGTVMVVHTHRKQAQPITLAHYLMAHAEAIGKATQRYEDLYRRINLNPLGSAASAGTGFPLDRARTRELLGFDDLVVNNIEGVAGWDHIAELAASNSIHMAGLSRLASELQLWQMDEFGALELDGSFAGTSSIMPQKKNPSSLELTRRAAAEALGDLVAVVGSLGAIEYQHSSARVPLEPVSIDRVLAATRTMTGVIRTMAPNVERMRAHVDDGYATMTELTDTLVRESGLSFREAHDVIARLVDDAIARGRQARELDLASVQAVATRTLGRPITLSAESLAAALDPRANVERRAGIGGPAPEAVRRAIAASQQELAAARTRLDARRRRLAEADARLDAAEAALLAR